MSGKPGHTPADMPAFPGRRGALEPWSEAERSKLGIEPISMAHLVVRFAGRRRWSRKRGPGFLRFDGSHIAAEAIVGLRCRIKVTELPW